MGSNPCQSASNVRMNEIILLSELRARGLDHPEIRHLVRTGELERIRRGAYSRRTVDASIEQRHRRLISAITAFLGDGAAISHGSAAVMHGLPVWRSSIARIHATRSRSYGGRRRKNLHVHPAPLVEDDTVIVDGVLTTSLARTVLDLSRTIPLAQAVAAGDRALATGLTDADLSVVLARMERWPGVRRARVAASMLDARSESPGESFSRVELVRQGLPQPQLQVEILDRRGGVIGRGDFGWDEHRTIGEFDGRIKYGRLLRPGEAVEDVVYAEKLREDAIRDEGWQVVRWTWSDLKQPDVLADRIRRAFERSAGGRASGPHA